MKKGHYWRPFFALTGLVCVGDDASEWSGPGF